MNLIHLKYAIEIAETLSMTKAANRLYTTQPNLSRAIKELESSLGINIFKRTSKGIILTLEGEEFLQYARSILRQVDAIEEMYNTNKKKQIKFSISVPRASYISTAFTEYIKEMNIDCGLEAFYKETNALRAINNICDSDYKLGIIRYQDTYDEKFKELLKEKDMHYETIFNFHYLLLFSNKSKLAKKEKIFIKDLKSYVEIAHADPFVPSMSLSTLRKNEISEDIDKHIYVFERGSQMDLLSESPNTFMWVSPVPKRLLQRYKLVQKKCIDNDKIYKDVLIYKNDYKLSQIDKQFLEKINIIKNELKNDLK
ncbi:MAG: LysR family transcriptional regulator [Eubacteriales bacterium]|nr:LysR family transcriptional regulator [Eubacteriales bacterium]